MKTALSLGFLNNDMMLIKQIIGAASVTLLVWQGFLPLLPPRYSPVSATPAARPRIESSVEYVTSSLLGVWKWASAMSAAT